MGTSLGLALAFAAALQAPQAMLGGVVTDAGTGRPLPGATIVLVDEETAVLSDAQGAYLFRGVPAGPQHVAVTQLGYHPRTVHALVPAAGPLVLDVALEPDPIRLDELAVEARALGRPADLSSAGSEVGGHRNGLSLAEVRGHPLLAEPDVLRALVGGGVAMDPESPAGLHVRGGDASHTAFLLDGIPVLDPVHAGGTFSAWSTDALAGIELIASPASSSLTDALSGAVFGSVRAPGERMGVETSLSTTHAALTVRGPVGGAGYVASFRNGFTGVPGMHRDDTYLDGESGDGLIELQVPWLGGTLEALHYGSESELVLGTLLDPTNGSPAGGGPAEWTSRSLGVRWRGGSAASSFEVKAWNATSATTTTWLAPSSRLGLDAHRSDWGGQASARFDRGATTRELGLRVERIGTDFSIAGDTPVAYRGALSNLALFASQATDLGAGVRVRAGGGITLSRGDLFAPAHLEVAWRSSERWTWSASVGMSHQFTQSLSNTESVARHVLPVDLSVVAGVDGVPVPSSEQVAVGASFLAAPGLRVSVEGFATRQRDLVLVAPVETGPFATAAPTVGGGSARGTSLELVGSSARLQWLAAYTWQRVTRRADVEYAPLHGAPHALNAGLVVHPTATWSLRASLQGIFGRRGTEVRGPFEWEACNLRDRGCEFAGAPELGGTLGGTALPAYLRADVGVSKHWHLSLRGRETVLGAFATVTNVFGRGNVLTYVRDAPGVLTPVDMQPTGPISVGLDWRY